MIKPPILYIEGNDVVVFLSKADAESWFEPWIVKDAEAGDAYDSAGHLLKMEVGVKEKDQSFLWFKWKRQYQSIMLIENDSATDHSAELKNKLRAYLVHSGIQEKELQNASLANLSLQVGGFMPWKKQFKTT
jgi:hypothetical protein